MKFQIYDVSLYTYFSKKFNETIHAQGKDFFEELKQYKIILAKVHAYCKTREPKRKESLNIISSTWNEAFIVKTKECKTMSVNEIYFSRYVGDQQDRRWLTEFGPGQLTDLKSRGICPKKT